MFVFIQMSIFYSVGCNPVLSVLILVFRLFQIWPLVALQVVSTLFQQASYLYLSTSQLPVSLLIKI